MILSISSRTLSIIDSICFGEKLDYRHSVVKTLVEPSEMIDPISLKIESGMPLQIYVIADDKGLRLRAANEPRKMTCAILGGVLPSTIGVPLAPLVRRATVSPIMSLLSNLPCHLRGRANFDYLDDDIAISK